MAEQINPTADPAEGVEPLALDAAAIKVLQKYKLVDASGRQTFTNLKVNKNGDLPAKAQRDHVSIGSVPRMEADAIMHFVAADKTPNRIWLDWMLHQAAGGDEGKARTNDQFQALRGIKLRQWTTGKYTVAGKERPPLSMNQAEEFWKQKESTYWRIFEIGDDDVIANWQDPYGFSRQWPGVFPSKSRSKNGSYAKIVKAVTEFQEVLPDMRSYNSQNPKRAVSTNPDDYSSVKELTEALASIKHFFASQESYDDVDYDLIEDSDVLTALAPLTYRAAVEYGWDDWAWANREKFEQSMRTVGGNQNEWSEVTRQAVPVFIVLKTPAPGWIRKRTDTQPGKFVSLVNMALHIPISSLKTFNPGQLQVWDEENQAKRNWTRVVQMVLDATPEKIQAPAPAPAGNAPAPDEDEQRRHAPDDAPEFDEDRPQADAEVEDEMNFVKVGSGETPYQNAEEAEHVARSLTAVMQKIQAWAKSFDPARLHSDYLTKRKKT